jgi:hypothetical protein
VICVGRRHRHRYNGNARRLQLFSFGNRLSAVLAPAFFASASALVTLQPTTRRSPARRRTEPLEPTSALIPSPQAFERPSRSAVRDSPTTASTAARRRKFEASLSCPREMTCLHRALPPAAPERTVATRPAYCTEC